jgi:hypothetical protein
MKRVLLYTLVAVSLAVTSCMNDVLDKEPLSLITDATVWEDPVLIDSYLATQYNLTSAMVNDASTYFQGWGAKQFVNGSWGNAIGSEHWGGFLDISNISDEARSNPMSNDLMGVKAGGLNINGGLLEYWEYPYLTIRNLNEFIERVPASPMDADLIKKRVAEARFLRAFNYFHLVKRYGGVPLITKVQNIDDPREELYPARNKEQEIYDYVIAELDAISADFSEAFTYGRASKWAALALKSRVALYAGSIAQFGSVQLDGLVGIPQNLSTDYYQKAYNAANEIINSGLFQLYNADADKIRNFINLFMVKGNKEVIMARKHNLVNALDNGGGAAWGWDFFQSPKPHGWNGGMGNCAYLEMAEEFEHIDGTPGTLDRNAIQQGLWSMEDLWKDKDPRFFATLFTMETPWKQATIEGGSWKDGIIDFHNGLITPDGTILKNSGDAYGGIPAKGNQEHYGDFSAVTGFGVLKYCDENLPPNMHFSNSGVDYQVFRYAEVLLNFAEAAFALNKTGEALSAVNQIRTRAGIAPLGSVTRDNIRHERQVELAFEGHRYWDVRRWRIATTELSRPNSGLKYILDYTTKEYKLEVLDNMDGKNLVPKFHDYNYYLPITLKRTGANSNLVENPGYK